MAVHKVFCGSWSDIGLIRAVNQDAVFAQVIGKDHPSLAVGAIFDGIGGMQQSEKASGIALQEISKWAERLEEWIDSTDVDAELICSQLCDVLDSANDEIIHLRDTEGIRSGTTATTVVYLDGRYHIYHIGDSRCMLYSNGVFSQITTDDTVVGFDGGRQRVFLANFLGKEEYVRLSSYEDEIVNSSMLIYGSDGFFHTFSEEDAADMFEKINRTPSAINDVCHFYVDQAMERGETDNISVGVIYIT